MNLDQLQLVKQQAEQRQQAISDSIQQLSSLLQHEEAQLSQLRAYEQGYLQKIQAEQHQWHIDHTQRYRHFCYQLTQTISIQEEKRATMQAKLKHLQQSLAEQHHKINVLDNLAQKALLASAALSDKHMQKALDDLVARRFFYD